MTRPWSAAELALVADQGLSLREVAELTGRSQSSVEHKAARLGVDRSFRRGSGLKRGDDNPWSPGELALLPDLSLSLADIAASTGRTYGGVKAMASRVGAARHSPWTEPELALLHDVAVPLTVVALRLGRPLGTVYAEASLRSIVRGVPSGTQHYRWVGGLGEDNRSDRGPDWYLVRKAVLDRDGYTCQEGGEFIPSGKGLVVHHVIPYRLRPSNDKRWLVTLCVQHHLARPEHFWREIPARVQAQLDAEGGDADGCL